LISPTLIAKDDDEGGAPKLWDYLKEMSMDIMKDTDIVEWWQVSMSPVL